MPALDQLLGSANVNLAALSGTRTLTITTGATAAATTRIAVEIGFYSSKTSSDVTGVTIGGQAAHRDLSTHTGPLWLEVWSIPVTSGLASSSAITATFSIAVAGDVLGVMMGAVSMSGVDMTSGGGVQTTGTNGVAGTPSTWTTNAVTNTAAGFAFGGVANAAGGIASSNTQTAGSQAYDIDQVGDQDETVVAYSAPSGAGTVTFSGTFSVGGFGYQAGMVIYSAGAPDIGPGIAPAAAGAGTATLTLTTPSTVITRATGFPVTSFGSPLTSLAVTTQNVGDALVVAVGNGTHATQATGVTCAKVGGGFTQIDSDSFAAHGLAASLWWGTVTATGATTVTITGTFATDNIEIVCDELAANVAVTWSVDVHGHGEGFPFPSLTPALGGAECYWGYAVGNATLGAGATPGFTYTTTGDADVFTFNPAIVAGNTYAPAGTEPVGFCSTVAAVFSAATQTVGTTVWIPRGLRPRQKLPRATTRGRYIQFPWGQAPCVAPWAPPPTHARVRAAFRRRPSRTSVPIVGAARPVNPLKTSRPSRPRVKPGLLRRGRTFTPGFGQATQTARPYIRYPTSCTLGAAIATSSRQDAATFTSGYTAKAAVVNYTSIGAVVGTETSTSILPNTTTITYQ